MILESELHSPKNETGRFLDHPDAGRLQVIYRLQVIQLIGFVVSPSCRPDRARSPKNQAAKAHWMIQHHDRR
jgi:hypothetical protein